MRGRDLFAWHARVKPIGLPLAVIAAVWTYRRTRSGTRALAVAGVVMTVSYLEARLEFVVRRRRYRGEGRRGACDTSSNPQPARP